MLFCYFGLYYLFKIFSCHQKYLFLLFVKFLCTYIKRILSQRNQKTRTVIARHKIIWRASVQLSHAKKLSFEFMACEGLYVYNSSQGVPVLNSEDNALRTIIKSRRLKAKP